MEVEHAARRLEAWVSWRAGRRLRCPECVCPGYDQLAQRTWRHLDACGYTTLLHASVPRCECPGDGRADKPSPNLLGGQPLSRRSRPSLGRGH